MAIDVVVDEVADNLEEIAQATRRINTNSAGFFLGGAVVGFAVGVFVGYRWNKEKIKAEAFRQSEEEVARIREHYQQKTVASTPKPPVEEVVEELGYARPLPAPVPGIVEPETSFRITEPQPDTATPAWDYRRELRHRAELDEGEPYVIHQDEFMNKETEYSQVTYTYYALDDVLVDEENGHPLPHGDAIVGVNNLQFGHGTDDDNVVFVRNDKLQLEMEICKIDKSYEEEVLGIENSEENDDDDDDDD